MTFSRDVVYALRRLAAKPGFSVSAILTLTLGVGFNAAVFTFVNAFLIRPLPVAEPARLMSLDFGGSRSPVVSFPDYRDIRDRNQVFSEIAASRSMPVALGIDGENSRIWGYLVTGNYFAALGISPWRGRFIAQEDDGRSPSPVVVLSYAAWQRRFGGDVNIVGRKAKINGEAFMVIGVAPPGFIGTERFYAAEFWVPFSVIQIIEGRDWRENRMNRNAASIGRLKPDVSVKQAEASLSVLASQMAREHPDISEGFAIHLSPPGLLGSTLRGPVIGFSAALLAIAGLTLLVACTNLSGLMLARAADRRKEMAIRVSLGAGRTTIVRLMLIESLLLGFAGAALGLIAAVWLSDAIRALLPMRELPLASFDPDWRVFAFGVAAATLTSAFSALLPSLRAAAVDVAPALKNEAATGVIRGFHLRDVYLGIQVAVCTVLLCGSMMMVRTLRSALTMNFGFNPDHVVALRADLATLGFSSEQIRDFQHRLIERIRQIPGIEVAALSNSIPFSIDQSRSMFTVEGKPVPKPSQIPMAASYESGPGYFRAMGTRLLAGRDFDERDRATAPPVAIVNQTLADQQFPGENPLSKRIRFGTAGNWFQIVGVVEAGRYQTITEDLEPAVWRPIDQQYNSSTMVIIRSRTGDQQVLAAARRICNELNPDLAIYDAMPVREFMDLPLAPLRLSTGAITLMGGLAALLCALGLYALLAYSTVQRTREIGIRMALGARTSNVLGVLLRKTMLLVAGSAALGITVSFFAVRILAQFLYAKSDSSIYAAALGLLVAVSLFACAIPARRALRIQPSDALRHE